MYSLAVAIIALVLLQQGKGSDLGSAFGGGSSNSMFGALGPSDFLGKLTYSLVALWLVLTMALAYLYKTCLLYTSPSPRDYAASRMPSSA